VGARGRGGIAPFRKVPGGVKKNTAAQDHHYQTDDLQSFVLLVVLKTAATKKTVLTPAPTEASVNATSTAPIRAQSRHIKKLYAPKRMAEESRSLTEIAAMAHRITRVRIGRSSCQITGCHLLSLFDQGLRPALTPASTMEWVAVGLERNTKTTMRMILRLVRRELHVRGYKLKRETAAIMRRDPRVSNFPAGWSLV
jgi:hypothetical protein